MRAKILYLDPPWNYPNNKNDQGTKDFHLYPKLSTQELCDLPVPDLLDPSGIVFCWYTGPMVGAAAKIMEAWRLDVINWMAFVWVKLNPKTRLKIEGKNWTFEGGFYSYGAGGYTCTNAEAVLVARPRNRSAPIDRVDGTQRQLVFHPVGSKSRKPEVVRSRIGRIYDLPSSRHTAVELFATQTASGWISLGNMVDGRDIRESLPNLIQTPEIPYEDRQAWSGNPALVPVWASRVATVPKARVEFDDGWKTVHRMADSRYVLSLIASSGSFLDDAWIYHSELDAVKAATSWDPSSGEDPAGVFEYIV